MEFFVDVAQVGADRVEANAAIQANFLVEAAFDKKFNNLGLSWSEVEIFVLGILGREGFEKVLHDLTSNGTGHR